MVKPVFQQVLLGMLFLWVPLAFFVRAADGFTLTKELVGMAVVAYFGVLVLIQGRWLFRQPLVQAVVLFTLWMVGNSLVTGFLKMEVLKGSVHLLLIAGTFLAVVFSCGRGFSYEKLLHFSLLAGMLMAIHGLVQTFGMEGINWNNRFESRAFATLGNPNYLGGHLVGLLPLAFGLTLRSAQPKSWLWFRVVSFALFAGLLVTRVRGSYLALAGAMLFILGSFLMPWGTELLRRNLRYVGLVFTVLLIGGGAYLQRHGGLALFSRSQVSVQQRLDTYKIAWEMVKDHPWFGIGLGQLGVQFPPYQHRPFTPAEYPQHPYTYSEHVHNEFLQFWVEGGLPGFLLFLGLLAVYFYALWRFWRNSDQKKEDKELLIGVAAGIIALLIQSLSNFPLQVAPTAVMFGLYLAAPLALRPSNPHSPSWVITPVQKGLLVLAVLIVMVLGTKSVAASIAYRDTVGETSLNNFQNAVYYGQRLTSLSPWNYKAWYAYGKALEGLGQYPQVVVAYGKAVEINPNYVEGMVSMANNQLQMGQFEDAVENFRKVEAITPNYSGAIWLRAAALYQLKRYDEAAKEFEKYLVCVPDNAMAYSNLGVCYIKLKHKEDAVAAWKKALALNPNDPQVIQYLKAQGVRVP